MTKKDLACCSWRSRFGIPVRLADFKICLDINTATARKIAEVIIGSGVEREDSVPCDTRVRTDCQKQSIVRLEAVKIANVPPSGPGGGGG